jgi:hypothetical protein
MIPCLAVNDTIDGLDTDTVHGCERLLFNGNSRTDSSHAIFRQFGEGVFLSARHAFGVEARAVAIAAGQPFRMKACAVTIATSSCFRMKACAIAVTAGHSFRMIMRPTAALACTILHIICSCSWKEMRRIAARWIVTGVQDLQAVWYLAIRQFPCDTGCNRGATADGDLPVARVASRGFPQPAFIRAALVNLVPKAFGKGTATAVSMDKAHRLAPDPSLYSTRIGGQLCFLSATASA